MSFKHLSLLILALILSIPTFAQDTVWVNTLNFNDITKRRDKYVFPPKAEYRKILMYYTLKCDAATTRDKYGCGEWDYLTYNFVYDHNATYDSTFKTRTNYTINGATPDETKYTLSPLYDTIRQYQKHIVHTDTTSLVAAEIDGLQTDIDKIDLNNSKAIEGKSQFLVLASELVKGNVAAGKITGLKLYVTNPGTIQNFKIAFAETKDDSLTWDNKATNLSTVYNRNTDFDTGWVSLQFTTPFNWTGKDNIVVEFGMDQANKLSNNVEFVAFNTNWKSGITKSIDHYTMNFSENGSYIDLGYNDSIMGTQHRTIEMWAKTANFNSGGLFQAGTSGTLKDFTLRTMGDDNKWRIQLWGADGDATLADSKDKWHHFALVYNGKAAVLYYDGKFVRQKTTTINTARGKITLAKWQGSYYKGEMSDVRIWNSALKPATLLEWKDKNIDGTHPDYNNLIGNYRFENGNGISVINKNGFLPNGDIKGASAWHKTDLDNYYRQATQLKVRPHLILEQGVFTSKVDSTQIDVAVERTPKKLVLYDNPADNKIIKDGAKNHPSLATETIAVWSDENYTYVYDKTTGNKLDSSMISYEKTINKATKEWYSPTVRYEIGRFITPYGINLSLGKEGFTWMYDVTDYAGLLHDTVDFQAGNQQELIDVKFALIKGKPERELKKLDLIWPYGSYRYKDLDSDAKLEPKKITLEADAATYKVRTVLTGHGHNSNDGSFPHCCEWKDNTHYLFVNGNKHAEWHIWRDDCDHNPVFPQGGTWTGEREGWCPGDIVPAYDWEITNKITNKEVELDYRLTPVPASNLGMGNGNYVTSMQLFQYGDLNHQSDAEITMVKRPNDWRYMERINPACESPLIEVRNAGKKDITSMKIEFGVAGGTKETFDWSGSLKFGETEEVLLQVPNSQFWVGDNTNKFTAKIIEVNGAADENNDNNIYNTSFSLPDIVEREIVIEFRTNNFPQTNAILVKDAKGNIVFAKDNFTANTIYKEELKLDHGCYTFELLDGQNGLDYWAWPEQGTGYIRIKDANNKIIKNFNANFGENVYWPFAAGSVSTIKDRIQPEVELTIYPNPNRGNFILEMQNIKGRVQVQVINALGAVVYDNSFIAQGFIQENLKLNDQKSGLYFVKTMVDGSPMVKSFVIE